MRARLHCCRLQTASQVDARLGGRVRGVKRDNYCLSWEFNNGNRDECRPVLAARGVGCYCSKNGLSIAAASVALKLFSQARQKKFLRIFSSMISPRRTPAVPPTAPPTSAPTTAPAKVPNTLPNGPIVRPATMPTSAPLAAPVAPPVAPAIAPIEQPVFRA